MSFYRDFNENLALEAWNTTPRAVYETFKLTRLSPSIGADVEGIDLSQDLSDHQFDEIRRAFAENLVLAFRDQSTLTTEAHKRFGRRFGTLHKHVLALDRKVAGGDSDPELLSWRTGKDSRYTAGNAWHNDVSCDAHPIFASLLHVTELPETGGGDTAFINLYLAYDSLSDAFKGFLDGLTAVHDGALAWTAGYGAKPQPGQTFPATEHPVVARHPYTGRKFLYVNQGFTSHIVQLTKTESDAVLTTLFRHVEKSLALQTRVRQRPHTLLLWDNWATQHHAVWDYYPFERRGARVSAHLDHGPKA
jgi:taurine dioxygenase